MQKPLESGQVQSTNGYHEFVTRINLDHVDKICEVLECDISDLIEYVPNQHKITGKDLIVEEHGNRKPKKKQ